MRLLQSRGWKDRLPGALFALALQAALFALLAASFTPQHRSDRPAESVLLLPRLLQRPVPVIDARQPARNPPVQSGAPPLSTPPLATAPPPETQVPEPQAPSAQALLTALGRALTCEPDADGRASPLLSCRGVRMRARNDMAALAPSLPVHREAELAAERARANTPARVPCVSMQTTNMGFGQREHAVMVNPLCALEELIR
jgi:hypothetical protein